MILLQLILLVLQIHGKILNSFVTSITHLEVPKLVELWVPGTLTLSSLPRREVGYVNVPSHTASKAFLPTIYAVVSELGLNPQGHEDFS